MHYPIAFGGELHYPVGFLWKSESDMLGEQKPKEPCVPIQMTGNPPIQLQMSVFRRTNDLATLCKRLGVVQDPGEL